MDSVEKVQQVLGEVRVFLEKDIIQNDTPIEEIKFKAMFLLSGIVDLSIKNKELDPHGETLVCPYKESLINQLTPVKSGILSRQELLCFIRKKREYFVVLMNDWLLFYNSNNSNKKNFPVEAYKLENITAKSIGGKGSFTLKIKEKVLKMSTSGQKNTEKMEWVSAINDINNFKTRCDQSHNTNNDTINDNVDNNKLKKISIGGNIKTSDENSRNHSSIVNAISSNPAFVSQRVITNDITNKNLNGGSNLESTSVSSEKSEKSGDYHYVTVLPVNEDYQFVPVPGPDEDYQYVPVFPDK